MTTPIRKRIKAAIGRFAGRSGALSWRYRTKMISVAFHRINDAIPEDGLTYGSAKFEAYCEFFRTHFRVVPLSEQVAGCSAGKDMGGTCQSRLTMAIVITMKSPPRYCGN